MVSGTTQMPSSSGWIQTSPGRCIVGPEQVCQLQIRCRFVFLFSLGKVGQTASTTTSIYSVHVAAVTRADDVEEWTSVLELPQSVKELMAVMTLPKQDCDATLQESNILAYIAGYVCKKVKSKTCKECFDAITDKVDEENQEHTLLSNKRYSYAKNGLHAPSKHFLEVIKRLEEKFREVVTSAVHQDKVRVKITHALSKLPCVESICCCGTGPQKCCVDKIVVNLFTTMRLHFALKLSVRDLSGTSKRRNRKTLKFSHM